MEHGSFRNDTHASFTLAEEDHTLGNALRYVLCQDPRVTTATYNIQHPSLERVSIQVQTTGDPAREVFRDGCQELMLMNRHVRTVFDKAVAKFKVEEAARTKNAEEELKKQRDLFESMDIESN
ncbi:DNA-directed RNA polymerases II, IV and V subunit 11 [Cardamine amara subsp. amara]|uniref:DNA-directed RNA polymerases II, IV and V subunit 11 n=1 Tax=Cardamine amara subsp. amara TaxID=228776 RepID=A0ABD0ZYE7_CARAN